MANGNNIDLVGNLTREPELRFTQGGMAVATFGLAVNRRVQNRQTNDWEDRTSFFDVVCYGSLGENVAESVTKGSRVLVVGRLEQRSWETQDGPSLRWASADVTKNDRRDGGTGGGGGGGGGFSRPARNDAPPAYEDDEEPF
jgi:single-strand DNA-binding protein